MDVYIRKILEDSIKYRYCTEAELKAKESKTKYPIITADAEFVSKFTGPSVYETGNTYILGGSKLAYSEFTHQASLSSTRLLSVPDVYDKLGISMEYIKDLVEKVRDKSIPIVVIGYGGMMINMIHIWGVFSNMFGTHIFSKVSIYEDDKISFSNLFRLLKHPFSLAKYNDSYVCSKFYIMPVNELEISSSGINQYTVRFAQNYISDNEDIVYIGAPDFETRDILSKRKFLACTHSDDKIAIISRPIVDSSITGETYGKIDVGTLFPNIYLAAVKMLEVMLKGEYMEDTIIWENNYATE